MTNILYNDWWDFRNVSAKMTLVGHGGGEGGVGSSSTFKIQEFNLHRNIINIIIHIYGSTHIKNVHLLKTNFINECYIFTKTPFNNLCVDLPIQG